MDRLAKSLLLSLVSAFVFSQATTYPVGMINFAFTPDTLNISQGDTVLWINQVSTMHTTTSGVNGVPDGIWDSGTMAQNDSFKHIFATAGDYPYYCTFHWSLGMIGLIKVAATSIEENSSLISSPLVLAQIFPEPFLSQTTISYWLMNRGNIDLGIYDLYGVVVRTLVKSSENAGSHAILWDGKNDQGLIVPAGIYFVKAQINNESITKKLVKLL